MKKMYVFTPVLILLLLITTVVKPAVLMSEHISENVFRLHILANSDSDEDQALKLCVRDEILQVSAPLYINCHTVQDAAEATNRHLVLLQQTAESALRKHHCADTVRVYVTKEYFSTRCYENYTLPAGVYDALKIEIGKAEGHNWWCVMFPAVCISGCAADFSETLTPEEQEMIASGKYVVRFKAVEIVEKIKSKL